MEVTPVSLRYLSQIPTEGNVILLPALKTVNSAAIILAELAAEITDFLAWLKFGWPFN